MTSKSDTIAAILRLNPTAEPEFLSEFSNQELDAYLHRLRELPERRPVGVQNRRGGTPLVAAFAPQAQT